MDTMERAMAVIIILQAVIIVLSGIGGYCVAEVRRHLHHQHHPYHQQH